MSREPSFGREKILEQFRELADSIDEPTTVYLIGGGAMTLNEQKTATKDVDIVVESTNAYRRVTEGLVEVGYSREEDVSREYEELEPAVILEKERRRFDIFDRQVAGELQLTDSIEGRSAEVLQDGDLEVRKFSDEDIFLFKAVANRPDDLGDMATLLAGDIDFDTVIDELHQQIENLGHDEFVTSIDKKLDKLQEELGVRPDIADDIQELAERSETASQIHTQIPDDPDEDPDLQGTTLQQLQNDTSYTKDEIQVAVNWLEKLGRVERRGDRVVLD